MLVFTVNNNGEHHLEFVEGDWFYDKPASGHEGAEACGEDDEDGPCYDFG